MHIPTAPDIDNTATIASTLNILCMELKFGNNIRRKVVSDLQWFRTTTREKPKWI